jgi:hypothetical protein
MVGRKNKNWGRKKILLMSVDVLITLINKRKFINKNRRKKGSEFMYM